MTAHRGCLLALLLAAMTLSAASAETGVFVRFTLLEPAETSYYVQIGGHIHVEPWVLPRVLWPAGADKDRTKRVGSGAATEWFDLGEHAGAKLHERLNRAGGVAEFPNITANFVTSTDSPARTIVIELATAPDERAVVKRFEESFTGSLTSVLVSPRLAADKDSLETAAQMTSRRVAWAREASQGTRVSPSQLIVQTSFWSPQRPELNLQEAEVLWLLGFNVVKRWPELRETYDFVDPGGHHWVKLDAKLTREDIDAQIRPPAQKTTAAPRPTLFNFSDEITSPALGTDAAALRHFHAWLQAQNVRPAELGVKALDEVVPIESPAVLRQRQRHDPKAANRVFFYTTRFRQAASTERLRWLTESFHRYAAANILTSSLVGVSPRGACLTWACGLIISRMDYQGRITIDPEVRFGKPCVRGTRITVGDVLSYLASGMREDQILSEFPQLTREDIRACLAFAAARERRVVSVPAA